MLSRAQLAFLLDPYLYPHLTEPRDWSDLYEKLNGYLSLLLKWNARTNLSSIRAPEDIVRRHFGESLFAGSQLSAESGPTNSLLDFGSGAGFPGIPIQLLHPALHVTLAESQSKKVAFLRELIRALELPTEIWPNRVEALPPTRTFHTVTVRAVDNMAAATAEAARRASQRLLILTTLRGGTPAYPPIPGFTSRSIPIPQRAAAVLLIADRRIVPRGTIA